MQSTRPHMWGFLAGLFLAAGMVLSSMTFTRAWMRISEGESISVTGSARKAVRSDLVVWRGVFTAEARELLVAQRTLKDDLAKVESFLRARGITNPVIGNIAIHELRSSVKTETETVSRVSGFRLAQQIEVRSTNVERIVSLDRETTALVEQGVLFTTEAPQFIYSNAGEAKVEMLAEATKDARARAEQIVSQGGRAIGRLKSAKMGVIQITPLHSIQTSWEGMNDTTSLEKTITAVVNATFSMQ